MSSKRLCPACEAYTSNVRGAFDAGQPCPHCGLSAEAAFELLEARQRGADAGPVKRAAEAERRAELAERAAATLRQVLERARRVLAEAVLVKSPSAGEPE